MGVEWVFQVGFAWSRNHLSSLVSTNSGQTGHSRPKHTAEQLMHTQIRSNRCHGGVASWVGKASLGGGAERRSRAACAQPPCSARVRSQVTGTPRPHGGDRGGVAATAGQLCQQWVQGRSCCWRRSSLRHVPCRHWCARQVLPVTVQLVQLSAVARARLGLLVTLLLLTAASARLALLVTMTAAVKTITTATTATVTTAAVTATAGTTAAVTIAAAATTSASSSTTAFGSSLFSFVEALLRQRRWRQPPPLACARQVFYR